MTITTVDLKKEAAAEVRRLTASRALIRNGDEASLAQLEGSAAWIAIARRTGLRRALGARVCLIWRVAIEDASGRIVESRLVPVLVEAASVRPRSAWIRCLLRDAEGLVRTRVEAASAEWQRDAIGTTAAFTSARLAREREVAGLRPAATAASQPGLFDRRVERSRTAAATAAAESEETSTDRQRATAVTGSIVARPAQLLLVLVP